MYSRKAKEIFEICNKKSYDFKYSLKLQLKIERILRCLNTSENPNHSSVCYDVIFAGRLPAVEVMSHAIVGDDMHQICPTACQ